MPSDKWPPNLIVIAPYAPYPEIDHAGGYFLLEYLQKLSKAFSVTLFVPGTPENLRVVERVPRQLQLVLVGRPTRSTNPVRRAWRGLRVVAAGVSPGPHILRAYRQSLPLRRAIQTGGVVEIQWTWFLPLVPYLQRLNPLNPITAFCHDIEHQGLRRRAAVARTAATRVPLRVAASVARRTEPRLLNRCDLSLCFSDTDRNRLRALGVTTPITVVPPPVTFSSQGLATSPEARAQTVLFVGNLRRLANRSGIEWFVRTTWPEVTRLQPEATLLVAGPGPLSADITTAPRVHALGYVEDLEELYATASVVVAPLLDGAGVKFKVAEALAHGLPVVATPVAAEGIVEPPGAGPAPLAAVSDQPTQLAGAIATLLADPAGASRIGAAALAWAHRNLTFETVVQTVATTYANLLSGRENVASQ